MVTKQNLTLSKLIVILLVLWVLGVATSVTLGGLIHILPVIAAVAVVLRIVQERDRARESRIVRRPMVSDRSVR